MQTIPSIWSNIYVSDLRAAGPVAMLVASFLQYKANAIGFFKIGLDEIGFAVDLPRDEIESALAELEKIRFLRYHAATEMAWIIDHAAWSLGKLRSTNKKDIATANAQFSAIPKSCPLRVDFLWLNALMLRLEVQGATPLGEGTFEDQGDIPADLLPKFDQNDQLEEPAVISVI